MMLRFGVLILLEWFVFINGNFIVEILLDSKFKKYLQMLHLDTSKIMKERRVLLHLAPLIVILPKKLMFLMAGVLVFLYFKPEIKTKRVIRKHQNQLHYEFPIWIRSIQCHLQSSNVVVSIEKSYDTAPQLVKYHLEDLIWKLSCEPHNLNHYEGFMAQYENYEIEKMMKFLYRFNEMDTYQGEKHLDRMIEGTGLWLSESRKKKQEEVLDQFSVFGILPVILVSVYFLIMMTMVIVGMMEGGWML